MEYDGRAANYNGGEPMGIFSRVKYAFSTEGTMLTSVRAYQSKFPNLSFLEALGRSLVETRPGWTQAFWDGMEPVLREQMEQGASEEDIISQVMGVEQMRKEGESSRYR